MMKLKTNNWKQIKFLQKSQEQNLEIKRIRTRVEIPTIKRSKFFYICANTKIFLSWHYNNEKTIMQIQKWPLMTYLFFFALKNILVVSLCNQHGKIFIYPVQFSNDEWALLKDFNALDS
jgi:hypothetical protein